MSASQAASAKADPPILRNPNLDGVNPLVLSRQKGMASLRIDRKPSVIPASLPVSPLAIQRTP